MKTRSHGNGKFQEELDILLKSEDEHGELRCLTPMHHVVHDPEHLEVFIKHGADVRLIEESTTSLVNRAVSDKRVEKLWERIHARAEVLHIVKVRRHFTKRQRNG